MDFAMLPPEVNSGRMYAGPGSGPMVAAAEAWDGLAAELHSAANAYKSVVAGLTAGPWLGPSSASMATAAASYVAWLNVTAAQAEQTAIQAKAAAAAYEEAFASTVPPPVIAANRAQLMKLVATNLLGQNASAIAATEAQYIEMWAQDAAAMYGYAASAAAATALQAFVPPPSSANPSGAATQAAAVGHATGTAAGNVQSTVSSAQQAFSAVPSALQSFAAAPAAAADPPDPLSSLANLISVFVNAPSGLVTLGVVTPMAILTAVDLPFSVEGALSGWHADAIVSGWAGVQPWPGTGSAPPTEFPAIITHPGPLAAAPTSSVSAGLGEANRVGALSVPPTWTISTPAVRPVALALPTTSTGAGTAAAAEGVSGASGSAVSDMALAGMTGSAMGGTLGTGGAPDRGKAAPGERVAARATPAATPGDSTAADSKSQASQSNPRTVVTGIAAKIREIAKLRDEGRMSDEEFTEQKKRLLGR
ncbi:MAG TPA: PPE domain-containing protein [Mycobacterium sp.]|uniref:PPE family protein, SVP subgroup n=1 Tax=Mycobacterium sp. TaxID=1785 RepID=UPI002D72A63E|nr:PPE domain-containing protein [Mycobacterium sp.]HZU49060.1 PPE domain-containing protein [Mycobacterium sp.]